MRCPKCGGYSFDSDERCLNCGYIASVSTRPPPWWNSKDRENPPKSPVQANREQSADKYSSKLTACPRCHEHSLFYNDRDGIYECLNIRCKAKGRSLRDLETKPQALTKKNSETDTTLPQTEIHPLPASSEASATIIETQASSEEAKRKVSEPATSSQNTSPIDKDNKVGAIKTRKPPPQSRRRSSGGKDAGENRSNKVLNGPIQNWLRALLLAFALSAIGLAISIFAGSFIPFWILFGFSFIFSIDKWFSYITRKHKGIGKLYRLLLNLSMLSLFGLLIWSGIKLFSQQFVHSPFAGSLIFLAEFIFFVWMWRVVSKNSWRWPSMKLTIFSLIALFLVLAFAGVQPMTSYKDGAFSLVGSTFSSVSKSLSVKDDGNNKDLATVREPNPTPIKTPEPAPLVPNLPKEPEPSPEMVAFNLINAERVKAGLFPTVWDEELYKLSKAHTQEMANRKELFHSPMGGDIGEDAWGGYGYSRFSGSELAKVIVESWMSSPLHKAWILHAPIQHSVVSIVSVSDGQYVSWTFWTSEVGSGPILIQKAYDLWQKETGGQVDWIKWLYDVKGYPDNVEFLRELGIK